MTGTPFALPPTRRDETPPVDAVRGFVFSSGRAWFQERGLFEPYLAHLREDLRERAFSITALEWLPLDDAMACYAACDALNLSPEHQREIGGVVSSANNGVVIETMARLAGGMGVSPWVALKGMHKVWLRSNRGGAVAIYKLDARIARLELWQVPLVASPFFRESMCGAVQAGIRLFRRSGDVVELRADATEDFMAMRASW